MVAALPLALLSGGLLAANRIQGTTLSLNLASTLGLVAAFAVIILLDAIFVASDVAMEVLRSVHVKLYEEDSKEYEKLQFLNNNKESVISACVLGATTMRSWLILLCFVPAFWLAGKFGLVVVDGALLEEAVAVFWIAVLLTIPIMGFNVAFAEIPARTYASVHPEKVALRSYGFLRVVRVIYMPFGWIATLVANIVTQRFGTDPRFNIVSRAEEEIKDIIDASGESGEIEEEEREMLQSVFEFGDTVARTVMTPRVDVESIPADASLAEVANLVESTGHSRFPVYEGSDDQILGIVHAKDILAVLAQGKKDRSLREIMRPAYFVPESKNLHDLLHEMRLNKTQLVIIQDEFGGTSGIVTIEDIVEEIVGDIVDEYDEDVPEVVHDHDKTLVIGRYHLSDLNEEIGSSFESDEFDTVGGYVFGLFGRQPQEGESIEDDGYRFVVEVTDGRRIHRVSVEKSDGVLDEVL